MRSELELYLETQLIQVGHPDFISEYIFHPVRKWRVDFAFPDCKLAIEVEGGSWSGGRHTRGSGFEEDCEKYNELAILGWKLIRVTGKMIKNGTGIRFIERYLDEHSTNNCNQSTGT